MSVPRTFLDLLHQSGVGHATRFCFAALNPDDPAVCIAGLSPASAQDLITLAFGLVDTLRAHDASAAALFAAAVQQALDRYAEDADTPADIEWQHRQSWIRPD